ncbi:hypothetical protein J7L05_00330 [bacterium]|nr:hypothetical protein [bacterium]
MFLIAYPVFLLAAFGMGLRLLSLFRYEPQSRLAHFFIAITLGCAFIGQFTFLLGLIHLLYIWIIWLVFILMILMNTGIVILFVRHARWQDSLFAIRECSFIERAFLFMSLIVLLMHAFFSLAPQISWDAMSHHYLVPEYFLQNHGTVNFPDVIFSYYPSLIEMQYLAGMALGGEITANLIGNLHGIMMYIGIFALAMLLVNNWRTGIWGGVCLLCTEGIHMHFEGGWNDLGVSVFIVASILMLFEYGKSRHRGVFILSSLLMGAALSSKHYAWMPFAFALLFVLYDSFKKSGFIHAAKNAAVYFLVAFSIPLLWYVRSFIFTGNPLYPFSIFGLFPTYHLPPFVLTSWVNYGFTRNPISFLLYPFHLMFDSTWIPELTGRLPYLFLFIPMTFVDLVKRDIRSIWIFILWTFVVMYFVAPFETRYMLYIIPFAAVLTGSAVYIMASKVKTGNKLVLPMVFVIFLIPFSINQKIFEHDLKDKTRVILKMEWRNEYLFRQSHTYQMIWWMNNHLPDDAHILCLEKNLYRLKRDYVTWPGMMVKYPENAHEAMAKNHTYGNTHMFLGEGGMAEAYVLWHIYHLPEDANGYVTFCIEDVLLNLNDKPIPDSFWILRLGMKRDLERWGFEKYQNDNDTHYRIKRAVLDDTVANLAALMLVDLFKDMVKRGWIELLEDDVLNMVFKFNYDKWIADTDMPSKI